MNAVHLKHILDVDYLWRSKVLFFFFLATWSLFDWNKTKIIVPLFFIKKKYFWQFYLELENTRFNIENIPDVLLTHSQRNITISYISNTLTLTASRVLKRIVHCTISLLQFCLKEGPLHVCFTPILLNTVRCLLSWREQSLRDRRLFSPRTLSSNPKFPITKMDYMRSHWRVASWPD